MVDISISHFAQGTASIDAGEVIVTFQSFGSLFTAVRRGDMFGTHVGRPTRILEIDEDNAQVTLAHPWSGPSQTAEAYEIQRTPYELGYQRELERLLGLLGEHAFFQYDAVIAQTSELSQYDARWQGFSVLDTSTSPMTIYVKASDDVGDWAGPSNYVQGERGLPSNVEIGTVDTLDPGDPATAVLAGESPDYTLSFGIPQGLRGYPSDVTIGTVDTLDPGDPATATLVGESPNYTLSFGIPQGLRGYPSDVTIGTVETLTPGSPATATLVGESPNYTLSFGIPQGDKGDKGDAGWAMEPELVNDEMRRVIRVADWVGGEGTKPEGIGKYVGQSGLVDDIEDAIDLRGEKGSGLQFDAQGTFAERSANDDAAAGFLYLSNDGDGASITQPVLFFKDTGATGDWSDPIVFASFYTQIAFKKFNCDGVQTTFTLDAVPTSAAHVLVTLDGVEREPGTAYTVDGSDLIFTGEVPPEGVTLRTRVLTIATGETVPPDGSVTKSKLASASVDDTHIDPAAASLVLSLLGGTPLADFEVVAGTNGVAIKLPGGLMICTGQDNTPLITDTVDGTVFRASSSTHFVYPIPFVEIYGAICYGHKDVSGTSGLVWAGAQARQGLTGIIAFVTAEANNSVGNVGYIAIGRYE